MRSPFLENAFANSQYRHLAQDEMETITEDRWDEDIWGVEHMDSNSKIEAPKLIFYFGADVSHTFSFTITTC